MTLTTGTPMFTGAGALEGYRVTGGAIQIDGDGLDTSRADYTDLITRSLQVNAGIWANQLQATLGNNVVSADHSQASATAASGEAPAFALDVGALGGMFANKIWLVGNEHGVGVRNAGSIGAQAGELVVTVDGRLENTGALQSRQNVRVHASGDLANGGTIAATREVAITAGGTLDNSNGTLTHSACSCRRRGCATMAAPLNRPVCKGWHSRPTQPATVAMACWVHWMPWHQVVTGAALAAARRPAMAVEHREPARRERREPEAAMAARRVRRRRRSCPGRGPDRHRRYAGQRRRQHQQRRLGVTGRTQRSRQQRRSPGSERAAARGAAQ